jgi:hypothetical protein
MRYEKTYNFWSLRRIICRKLHPRALGRQFAFDVIIVAGWNRRLCRHLDRIQDRGSAGYLRCTPSSNQHSMERPLLRTEWHSCEPLYILRIIYLNHHYKGINLNNTLFCLRREVHRLSSHPSFQSIIDKFSSPYSGRIAYLN